MSTKSTIGALAAAALVTLTGCGSSTEETATPKPTKTVTATATPEPEPEFQPDYRKVARKMREFYPGAGWDDFETAKVATENVCGDLEEFSPTEVRRFYAEASGAPNQASVLVGLAQDYVCPPDD